jgi:hypothetical protein
VLLNLRTRTYRMAVFAAVDSASTVGPCKSKTHRIVQVKLCPVSLLVQQPLHVSKAVIMHIHSTYNKHFVNITRK